MTAGEITLLLNNKRPSTKGKGCFSLRLHVIVLNATKFKLKINFKILSICKLLCVNTIWHISIDQQLYNCLLCYFVINFILTYILFALYSRFFNQFNLKRALICFAQHKYYINCVSTVEN